MLPTLWWKKAVANSDDDEHGDGPSEREREREREVRERIFKIMNFESFYLLKSLTDPSNFQMKF